MKSYTASRDRIYLRLEQAKPRAIQALLIHLICISYRGLMNRNRSQSSVLSKSWTRSQLQTAHVGISVMMISAAITNYLIK